MSGVRHGPVRLFQVRTQHPGHLLMLFHQARDKITGARITILVGKTIDVLADKDDDVLMIDEQFLEESLAVIPLSQLLRKMGQ